MMSLHPHLNSPLQLLEKFGSVRPEEAPCVRGTYMVINRKTCCAYFGQSEDVCRRLKAHRSNLRSGIHPNALLQASWDADGEAAFSYCILNISSNDALAFNYEGYYIRQFLGTFTLNYNTRERNEMRSRVAARWKKRLHSSIA